MERQFFKSMADVSQTKKPESPKSQSTANIASINSEGDPPGCLYNTGQEPHPAPKSKTQLELNDFSNAGCARAGSVNNT